MARIRTVKPEFFTHYELYEAEIEFALPLRVTFAGLWTQADREGRFKWRPPQLKLGCLPYDDVDFSRVLDALITRGFIKKYSVNGDCFGLILSFKDHQVINNKEKGSVIPEPPEDTDVPPDGNASGNAMATRERQDQGERKGKERKGKEREGKGSEASKTLCDVNSIFEHWQKIMNHANAKLTPKRKKKIQDRLKNYSVDDIKKSIDGCASSGYHMGTDKLKNPSGTIYDDLELICRDDDHIERFSGYLRSSSAHESQEVQEWLNSDYTETHIGRVYDHGQQ